MSANFLEKFAERHVEPQTVLTDEVEAADDHGCFGWLRGIRERAITLQLRKKTGNILAVAYSGMELEFEPSDGITLYVISGRTIRIKGQNLNVEVRPLVTLFGGLCRNKVPWIQEATGQEVLRSSRAAILVESIEW